MEKGALLSKMYNKRKGLAKMMEISSKVYVTERAVFSLAHCRRGPKKIPQILARKAGMLLKTHIEKMSPFGFSKISMKTNELTQSLQDVDEKRYLTKSRQEATYSEQQAEKT